jgi:hypothetical protein
MGTDLKADIKQYIEHLIQKEFEKYTKIYSKEELLTKAEFLEAIKLIQQRFEATDKRFEAMDKRFEVMDKRFEENIEAMNRGFLTLKASLDSFGQKSGIRLEKTILKLLQKTLENRDIDINKIEWIELIDDTGEVFSKNYRTDIDVIIKNGSTFLMEIKYKADSRDIFHFLKVAELYTKKHQKPDKLLLVSLEIEPKTQEYAENEKIEVITGDYN